MCICIYMTANVYICKTKILSIHINFKNLEMQRKIIGFSLLHVSLLEVCQERKKNNSPQNKAF